MSNRISAILDFWFAEDVVARGLWFNSNADFDRAIRTAFAADHEKAREGLYDDWQASADGALALIIALDQFPRNLFRKSPLAFASDHKAQAVAARAVDHGFDRQVAVARRFFFYMPFEHAESLPLQERSVQLFGALSGPQFERQLDFAKRHHDIIKQFGRFPHRNAVLGRDSTPAELAYLAEHPNEFG